MTSLILKDFYIAKKYYLYLFLFTIVTGICFQLSLSSFMNKGFLTGTMPIMFSLVIIQTISVDTNSKWSMLAKCLPIPRWKYMASKHVSYLVCIFASALLSILLNEMITYIIAGIVIDIKDFIYLLSFGICFASVYGAFSLPICILVNGNEITNTLIGVAMWVPSFYITGWMISGIKTSENTISRIFILFAFILLLHLATCFIGVSLLKNKKFIGR